MGALPPPETPPTMQAALAGQPATLTPAPTPRPASDTDLAGEYRLVVHPDGPLYVGDLVSFEVVVPARNSDGAGQVRIQVDPPGGVVLEETALAPFGIGGRRQATFLWAWDTAGLEPGGHTLEIEVLPGGPVWRETLLLRPGGAQPARERQAAWTEVEIPCCRVRYITHTAAERDLAALLPLIEARAQDAAGSLGIDIRKPISLVLLPRLLGHGGFAMDEIYVSYLDRRYTSGQHGIVLYHEIVHLLDAQLEGELRPTILAEGLAVYLSGGHYKDEPLFARAAALVELGWYLPLQPLSDAFYLSQHEIGYMEAGALVQYMVETWGLESVLALYHAVQPHESGSQARALDQALQQHFGVSFSALEAGFLARLEQYPVNPDLLEDVRLTVKLYEAIRRYQQLLDPSAYFLSAWLPDIDDLPRQDLVADYLRNPAGVENITLEAMLAAAGSHLHAGRYRQAEGLLAAVNAVLERLEAGALEPFSANAQSADYFDLVTMLRDRGYEVQRISLEGDAALVWAYSEGINLVEITTARTEDRAWVIRSLAE